MPVRPPLPLARAALTTSAVLLALLCAPPERAGPPLEGALPGQTGDVDVPAGAAVAVGDGYHVIGTIRPSRNACIAFDLRNDTTTGQFSELNIVEATSKSDLGFAMGLGLEAMYQSVGTRVDGKAELYHQSKVSNTQRSLVVKGVARNVERTGTGWRLTTRARELLASGGLADFDAQCGQMFAVAVRDGAEVWGVINFSSTSQEQVDSASAYVKGEGLNWSAKGDLAASVRSRFENTQMDVRFTRSGGAGEPLASGWEEMVKSASEIPQVARTHPVPLTFTLASYDPYVQPVLDSLGGADSAASFPTLEDIEPLRADLGAFASLMEDAAYVIAHPTNYLLGRGVTEREVDALRRRALALFNEVGAAASACLKGTPDACASPFGGTAADSAFALRKRLPLRLRTPQGLERWWTVGDVQDALEHDLRVFAARSCSAPAARYCVTLGADGVPAPAPPPVVNSASGKEWQYLALSRYDNSCSVTSDNTPQDAAGRNAVIWACNNRWNQTFDVLASGALVSNYCYQSCGVFESDRQKKWPKRKTNSRVCLTASEYRAGAHVTYDACNNGKSPSATQQWVYNTFGNLWLRPLVIPRAGPLLCVGVDGNKNANWQPLVLQVCDASRKTFTMQEWVFRSP